MEKIRAVIIDDEPLARRGIRAQLKEERDIEVVAECGNGRDAIRVIEEEKPDLLFLDIQMPELDGFDVIEAINTERLPAVIFVTALRRAPQPEQWRFAQSGRTEWLSFK